MKKFFLLSVFCLFALVMNAQQEKRQKFDPAKFEADLEQYITKEAALTHQEAAQFMPIYREMRSKQRACFDEMRSLAKTNSNDDKACRETIEKKDKVDIEVKEIQQNYHQKFMKVLAPSKVQRVIAAEERFHRQAFKRTAQPKRKTDGGRQKGHSHQGHKHSATTKSGVK